MRGESTTAISCVGACRPFWPLSVSTWGADASASCTVVGFVRADGDRQLACNNRPLYMFRDDQSASDSRGLSNPDFALA